jgi:hypothetical protein
MNMAYYSKILEITKDYLGPAAERFVDRQINSHLRKPPQELLKSDIPMLALRIRSGLVVLSKDENLVQEAFRRLTEVADI